jgi:hypothetical protein
MKSRVSITSQRLTASATESALAGLVTPAVAQIAKALLISAWLCIGAAPAFAQSLVFVKNVNVGGQGLGVFGKSFDDLGSGLYILADQTNASIDLLGSDMGIFNGRIGSTCPAGNPAPHFCFQGVVLVGGSINPALSGPNGAVIVDNKEIWAGDGDSRIKVIDISSQSFITTISTGGEFRVDEMAYDSGDHLLAAANTDTPPFVTIFDTSGKTIKGKLVFTTAGVGVDAENGIGQSAWSPLTGMFYISVPQVGADPSIGGVSVIDPKTLRVIGTFLVTDCSPAGLALGPNHEALIGCSAAFGTPATTQSLIIDITSTDFTNVNGAVVATVQIGGSDQVWYDPGTQHYFLAARNNLVAGSPVPNLGSIDAVSHQLDSVIVSSTTSHSVAADQNSHLVFLPAGFVPPGSPAGTDPFNPCPTTGCIAVYFSPPFAGTPGSPNCHGTSVSTLAQKDGGLAAAAKDLGFASVSALQKAIKGFCSA